MTLCARENDLVKLFYIKDKESFRQPGKQNQMVSFAISGSRSEEFNADASSDHTTRVFNSTKVSSKKDQLKLENGGKEKGG